MDYFYAPWRTNYTQSTEHSKKEDATTKECLFCTYLSHNDDKKYYIIKRFKHTFVILNRYPYNAGHILILPLEHCSSLPNLSVESRSELMEVISFSVDTMNKTLKAQGCNIGANLGQAAGAGIPSHLHMHVLPRWKGDTSFLPTIAQTTAVSIDLNEVFELLIEAFQNFTP